MNILQAVILVVLCIVILLEVRLPPSFRQIGLGPLVLLGVVILGELFVFPHSTDSSYPFTSSQR